jgi:hypothetical protein
MHLIVGVNLTPKGPSTLVGESELSRESEFVRKVAENASSEEPGRQLQGSFFKAPGQFLPDDHCEIKTTHATDATDRIDTTRTFNLYKLIFVNF